MPAHKGQPKVGGRKKGTPNKVTGDLRQMVRDAVSAEGGTAYLREQARENPPAFLALLGKCLPKELEVSVPDGITVRWSGEMPKKHA